MRSVNKRMWPKVLGLVLLCVIILIAAAVLWLKLAAQRQRAEQARSAEVLKVELYEGVNDLEYQYGQDRFSEIKEYHETVEGKDFSEYVVYYPAELSGPYPVVVWGNGSGGTYRDYEGALKSLTSYGFVVIGNDHQQTGAGRTIYEMALYAERLNRDADSIFCGRLDVAHIGVGGHSQGACGAVNAATKYERSAELFTSLFTTSMPKVEMCVKEGLMDLAYWHYDVSLIQMPYFATSGVGEFDESVAPLASMEANLRGIPAGIPAVIARQKGADHDIANAYHACGYMNAWFSWTLKGDSEAGVVFVEEGELFHNDVRWQDVSK